ncbi:MAG: mycofactocin biosynthesis glycosyltransferase MftF [Ilumatobacteraceae bacterium]
MKVMTMTAAGSAFVDRIAADDDITPTRAEHSLIDRLVDSGLMHPTPSPMNPPLAVTVVIPAFDVEQSTLIDLVDACRRAGVHEVIVVDDASPTTILAIPGATTIRHDINRGPGAARTTGAAQVNTPLIAFIDTDVVLPEVWTDALVAHFADERVALVAPRVAAVAGTTVLQRYEALHSPLDLGIEPARVSAGTRISYVPSAMIIVRADALRAIGGFEPSMRVGEDVDLVWRLAEAGHRLRYEPATTVHHRSRPTWAGWARQRMGYGSSAAPLARRHPGALVPVRVSGWSAAAWSVAVLGWPIAGATIAAGTTVALASKLRPVPDGPKQALRLAGLGNLFAGRALANALLRAWWPLALIGSIGSRRVRRAVAIAAIAPPLVDWIRNQPPIDPVRYVAIRFADDLAYGVGVARGVITERSVSALIPDFSSWPNRQRPDRPASASAG